MNYYKINREAILTHDKYHNGGRKEKAKRY